VVTFLTAYKSTNQQTNRSKCITAFADVSLTVYGHLCIFITDRFSSPGREIGPMFVCARVSG